MSKSTATRYERILWYMIAGKTSLLYQTDGEEGELGFVLLKAPLTPPPLPPLKIAGKSYSQETFQRF